jgi:hypothetical protein
MAGDPNALEILSAAEPVSTYESSPGFNRRFCTHCGAVISGIASDGHVFIPAANLVHHR